LQLTRIESKARHVEQIKTVLQSGDYSRALDLVRSAVAELHGDAELSRLERLAQDGVKRKAEADRMITESQELFAQQKSGEAIQLLRKAYELDKTNSLARAILANALVEHAHSLVETDWLEAEKLANQALALNPAHPTAKTILSRIVDQKTISLVEDWVSQARKLQSSGDLFASLAWVAEGLAVHPNDPRLLKIQDEIQRDQAARRRQTRRRDLEDLRRIELEIDGAADVATKEALVVRIQTVAARYWTDGEFLSVANGLLTRLGLVPQESSAASPRSKGAAVIFHVPRPSSAKAPHAEVPSGKGLDGEVPAAKVTASPVSATKVAPVTVPPTTVAASKVPPAVVPPEQVPSAAPEVKVAPPGPATVPAAEPSVTATKAASPPARAKDRPRSNSTTLIAVFAAAIVLVAAISFVAGRHHAAEVAKTPAAAPSVSAPAVSAPAVSAPELSAPAVSVPAEMTPAPSGPSLHGATDSGSEKSTPSEQPPAEPGHNLGTLVVIAGQDDAQIALNGKLQRQVTRAGQLRIPNLELKDYVVQVSKSGFQDAPLQKISVRKGAEAKLIFNLQPQPRLASLSIQGGAPGTAVFVDQTPVGGVQADGTLSVSSVNPGDHTVELRKERFKTRQFKKHFVAGGTVTLAAADAGMEAAGGELKITFSPPDANVAIVKGDLLKMVSSGVPLNLAPGTYTLTARTAERFTRSATVEVVAGQAKTLDLSLAPNGMSKWEDPGGWKREGDSFTRKGGDFVLYGDIPASGTFTFSAMLTKGHLLQWVISYSDARNYVLFQLDDNNFYRTVIRNGEKRDEIIVPHKGDKKSIRTLQIRVGPTETVHQIKNGDSWTVLDRWTLPGANLSLGKFGFYIPGSDQVALSSFAHYADLNIR